jgi:NADH:ubiquinone oxidoreductase subunit 4 (subunit M)
MAEILYPNNRNNMLVKRITLNKEIIISILIMYLFMYLTLLNNNNNIEIQYRINKLIGLDGINIPLILLTSIIYPIILIIREKYNKENNK